MFSDIRMSDDDYYVPYLRRRNSPAQLKALNKLFDATPHPTRAQRQALANEIGMELKSVTNWFQNRRQTSRRKSNENNNHHHPHPARLQPRSKTPLDRSHISLDRIATLSERPSETPEWNATRLPLTPRKHNTHRKHPGQSELWTHMLSSPVLPPSDPDPEAARLAALSSRATIRYPMEWACLKARQKKWVDEDVDHDGLCCETLLTRTPQFEDVEAAITLLDFKTRS